MESILVWTFAVVLTVVGATVGLTRRIDQGEEAVVQRFGRFYRKLEPGLNFGIIPIVDEIVIEADTRERILDIEPSEVVTKDGVIVVVNAVIFWRIMDLEKAYYEIDGVSEAVKLILVAALRSKIGEMEFQRIHSAREEINKALMENLDEATEPWGIKVTRVEIDNIRIPDTARGTLSLAFPEGVDLDALIYSLEKVIFENDGVELSFAGIETRDDGVLIIKVKVPPTADKDKILTELIRNYDSSMEAIEQKYQAELSGKDSQIAIYERKCSSFEEIIHKLVDRPIQLGQATIEVKAIAGSQSMNDNIDQSQNLNVGRDMNLSGSTLNLGEISGSVTNSINQLASNPEAAQLADLLKQLQAAIEAEPQLSTDDKALALEQTGNLTEAAKSPADETSKKPAKLAVGFLKGMAATLPDTANLVEACAKLLPLITSLIGL